MRNLTDEETNRHRRWNRSRTQAWETKVLLPEKNNESLKRNDYGLDIECWAYCLYMDHVDFDRYHRSIGETCDYETMKESMISAVTDHESDSWFEFDWDLSWLELPDIDLSSIFDFIDL